jgi:ribosomal protein S18 acetylase RimI-like enzyme
MSEHASFDIRPSRAGDYPALLALSSRLTIGAAPWRDRDRVAAAARGWIESSLTRAETEADRNGVFVAVSAGDGEMAGLVSVTERTHYTGEVDAYIGELVTDAAFEGQGAARALVAAAEAWAAARDLTRITLETGAGNTRARRFYALAGFAEEDLLLSKPVRPGSEGAIPSGH